MSGAKLKNLILLILALTVAFLLAAVIPVKTGEQRTRRAVEKELRTLFAESSITLPAELPDAGSPLSVIELNEDDGSAQAAALLGADAAMSADSTAFLSRWTGEKGSLTIRRSGAITAELTGTAAVRDEEADARRLLEAMGCQLHALHPAVRKSAGVYMIEAEQALLGVPVFGETMQFTYTNGALRQASGTVVSAAVQTVSRVSEKKCCSCADALVRWLACRDDLGWIGSAVTAVQQGYVRTDAASAAARFTPVWRIDTDSGSFYVSGISGEVSRPD